MKTMTLEYMRRINVDRVPYSGHGDLENGWNVAEWGCAFAGEAGELCNVLKKINRQAPFDPDIESLRKEAKDEIGDVLAYLDLVAAKLDLNLAECVADKFNDVSRKYDYPQRMHLVSVSIEGSG